MTIGSTESDYLQELINLTPPGGAFPTDDGTNWISFLGALAQIFETVDASVVSLSQEIFPDTTLELLPDWERVAGLPDNCTPLGATYQQRRANLITKLTNSGGQSAAYYIGVAAQLGYAITITQFKPFRTGVSAVTQPLCNQDWWFNWQVNAPLNTVQYFRAGQSAAGEPLAYWSNEILECVINKLKPAHTIVSFAYS